MRRVLLVGLLLLCWTRTAHPSGSHVDPCAPLGSYGFDLSWGAACWSDPGHGDLLSFACDRNTGQAIMTLSFRLPQDLPQFSGLEFQLRGETECAAIPDWWDMSRAGCRTAALSASNDFSASPHVGCVDPWAGTSSGGSWEIYEDFGTYARFSGAFAVPVEEAKLLSAGTEYYAAQIRMNYTKTVGPDGCAGCSCPMTWIVERLDLAPLTGSSVILTEGRENPCIHWAPPAVPARNHTWGAIKSLYRW